MFLHQTVDKRMQVKGETPDRILIAIYNLDSLLEKLDRKYAAKRGTPATTGTGKQSAPE